MDPPPCAILERKTPFFNLFRNCDSVLSMQGYYYTVHLILSRMFLKKKVLSGEYCKNVEEKLQLSHSGNLLQGIGMKT
jgi:hypothetical protein